jgi:glyoxylase-like metal-dependent hydrolase (beta-lactamase superfamily II)
MATLRLHVFNTGWVSVQERQLYVGGGSDTRTLPVLSFAIEHAQGLVVFDAGLSTAFATHPRQYAGWLNERVCRFRSLPGMHLSQQMKDQGLDPQDVTHVVLSHLHYDHTGDLCAFARARVSVSRQEWEAAQAPLSPLQGYLPREFAQAKWVPLDFATDVSPSLSDIAQHLYGHDLMADGTLVVVPTFGHTPGHQSLLAFLPRGVALLAGDAVYAAEGYTKPAAQPHPRCADLAWRGLIGLRALSKGDPKALIVPSHDDRVLHGLERDDVVVHDTHGPPAIAVSARMR